MSRKPTSQRALNILRDRRDFGKGWVTGQELIDAGAGNRFGGRLAELRSEGFEIETGTKSRSCRGKVIVPYRLIFDVERDVRPETIFEGDQVLLFPDPNRKAA